MTKNHADNDETNKKRSQAHAAAQGGVGVHRYHVQPNVNCAAIADLVVVARDETHVRRTARTESAQHTAEVSKPLEAFLVFVLDEADETISQQVVWAEDESAAEREAVEQRKRDHDLDQQSDEEAGFQAILCLSRDDLLYWLSRMDRKGDDDEGPTALA